MAREARAHTLTHALSLLRPLPSSLALNRFSHRVDVRGLSDGVPAGGWGHSKAIAANAIMSRPGLVGRRRGPVPPKGKVKGQGLVGVGGGGATRPFLDASGEL